MEKEKVEHIKNYHHKGKNLWNYLIDCVEGQEKVWTSR